MNKEINRNEMEHKKKEIEFIYSTASLLAHEYKQGK